MFTGIIEEIGKVKSIVRHSNSIKLTVAANNIMSDMHIGDSISTNGICLTVTTFDSASFTVDVMPETMMTTNFKNLKVNDEVNLERALAVNGRLGGHIVSGHIDGIGTIIKKYNDDKAIRMSFSTRPEILELIVKKDEGFAFVKQVVYDDDTTMNLVTRRQLGFEVSIVVIVLRQLLEDYDSNPTETQSLDRIITTNEIKDEVRLFLPESYNKVKLEKDLDTYIQRVAELGYLKEVKRNGDDVRYKIHRIIKEKVTIEDLDLFKKKLDEYAGTI